MLANGTLLGYKKHGSDGPYENLEGLKELPSMGGKPELIENTPIAATCKQYEVGVGDLGSMEYVFIYEKNTPNCTYRKLRDAADANSKLDFQEIWPDGTKQQFTAIPALSFDRGPINGLLLLKVTMALQSNIVTIDPDDTETQE